MSTNSSPQYDNSQCRQLTCGPLNKHISIYTRFTIFCLHVKQKSQSLSLPCRSRALQKLQWIAPVAAFRGLDSTHIWLYLGAKCSRSLQGQQMTLNKNSLGNLSQSRKGNKTAGWFTRNGSSKTQILIFVPIWSQCAKQAQSKLSFSEGL